MRIVGGKFKGRKLSAPEGQNTRPTSDRARESIFNILEHQDWGRAALRAQPVLDVFCGTGALGLEALSRGAKHATFMDNSEGALKVLRDNIKNLGLGSQDVKAIRCDALHPPQSSTPCGLILMDAPYKSPVSLEALNALQRAGWIDTDSLCVVEIARKESIEIPRGLNIIDERTYGAAKICFIRAT